MIANLGSITISLLQELSSLVWMGRETVSEIGDRIVIKRAPFRLEDFFYQCNRVGVGSVPMVILLSLFVGLTLALLTGYQLQIFGLVTRVPPVVSVSFTREMGPLFTGIVLASRIGAAYTAELGAVTAGGEVDAIEGMGIGALRYLVAPLTEPDSELSLAIAYFEHRTGPDTDLSLTIKNTKIFMETLNGSPIPQVIQNTEQLSDTLKRQPGRLIWPGTESYPGDKATPPSTRK